MWKEFKAFILRGNVLDLGFAVVIGAAFGAVVNSLVKDIIMPPIGRLLGGVNFASLFINLGPGKFDSLTAAQAAGAATINYGIFINTIITFLVVAFVVFLLVKAVNRRHKKEEPAPAAPMTKKCPECLSEIPVEAKRCAFCTTVLK